MDKAKNYLKKWIVDFIRSKDSIQKKLVSVEQDKDGFDVVVQYKDNEKFFIVEPIMENIDNIPARLDYDKHFGLVVLNTKKNFNMLIDNWEKLIKYKYLCIYFINPFSTMDKKWLIFPYTHNKICDSASLKAGLRTMFGMVETISEANIDSKF